MNNSVVSVTLTLPARRVFTTVLLLAIFTLTSEIIAQDPPEQGKPGKIEVLSYGSMSQNTRIDPDLIKLSGEVLFEHNEAFMWCDSAYLYDERNMFIAFGGVRISQGDTLNLYGDYLEYDGNSEQAFVKGNVELIDKETHLYTDVLNYDLNQRIAHYDTDGRIINGEDILTSRRGIYYSNEKVFHFSEEVVIIGPDYFITADTMNYHNEDELVVFTGPTTVEGDSIFIFGHQGWYDLRGKRSKIWESALINNLSQTIEGDTIYYEEESGYGRSRGNVTITDSLNNSIVKGEYAVYHKEPENILITDNALYIMNGENDTLYMHADTLRSKTIFIEKPRPEAGSEPEAEATTETDTTISYREVKGYHGARIFSNEFQAKCDSLIYSFNDSTIKLYHEPVIWSEENQLMADSITIFTIESQIDRMELYHNAFVISQVDSLRFNQTKGRFLTGYFTDNQLSRVVVEGNGESVYFLTEEDGLVGVNYSKSASIEIIIDGNTILSVTESGNPDGTLDPPVKNPPDSYQLQGFLWLNHLRPTDIYDVFRKM